MSGMDPFSALADPTRRAIIELLAQRGEMPATEIAAQFAISAPAVSQHLRVLRESGLVQVEKQAQRRLYRIDPTVMLEVEGWARRTREIWNQRLDALERFLRE